MVARLMKQQDPNFVINEDLSYAEVSDFILFAGLLKIREIEHLTSCSNSP